MLRTAEVRVLSRSATRGTLVYGGMHLPCAIGRGGIRARKREGDGASPRGKYRISQMLYRADRVARPGGRLPVRGVRTDDAWCDVAGDANYNRAVRLPYPLIDERLWRDDALYDIIGVLDYNFRPRIQHFGSAIFLHIARSGFSPTAGCVALARDDLVRLFALALPPEAIRFP